MSYTFDEDRSDMPHYPGPICVEDIEGRDQYAKDYSDGDKIYSRCSNGIIIHKSDGDYWKFVDVIKTPYFDSYTVGNENRKFLHASECEVDTVVVVPCPIGILKHTLLRDDKDLKYWKPSLELEVCSPTT